MAVEPNTVEIFLDIKPGNKENSINPRSKGVIPVAILGSKEFDVADIDVTKLRFGLDNAEIKHNLSDPKIYTKHLKDVDDDGIMDLVSHYSVLETGIECGDDEVSLSGKTLSNQAIDGTDTISTVGCKKGR